MHERECFAGFHILLALGYKLLCSFIFAVMICFKVAQNPRYKLLISMMCFQLIAEFSPSLKVER